MAYLKALSVAQAIGLSGLTVGLVIKNKPKMMWREAVLVYFKILFGNSPEGSE
jgi:hypothetical protein